MRVLWITNIVFPEAELLLTGTGELKASGGWMLGAAESLLRQPGIKLTVATVSDKVKSLQRLTGDRIVYYLLPYGKGNDRYNKEYEPLWVQVKKEVSPDVIHIHGSEFSHGLAYVRACGPQNVVVSIQGLVSVYARYYYSGLSKLDVIRNFTLRGILGRGIFAGQRSFIKRGLLEKELFQRANHIIGRTSWDKAHAWAINPEAKYHYVGETLRKEFYDGQWSYDRCKPHSIFLSQANYPVKALHMVLKAMPLILRHFPDAQLRIAGNDITEYGSLRSLKYYTDYGRIIHRMINKYNLEKLVKFTGPLDAEGMKREFLNTNVFVSPSTIENSPNSLGEAQVLGVPVIASYVGGVADMMKGDEDHIYRFEEIEMLAYKICNIFDSKEKQPQLEQMRVRALRRHDSFINGVNLLNAYKEVSGIVE